MWHVKDVRDVILIFFECNAIYVEDRSNTPKGCNAMYVEDVEDGKRTYTHIAAADSNHSLSSGCSLWIFSPIVVDAKEDTRDSPLLHIKWLDGLNISLIPTFSLLLEFFHNRQSWQCCHICIAS